MIAQPSLLYQGREAERRVHCHSYEGSGRLVATERDNLKMIVAARRFAGKPTGRPPSAPPRCPGNARVGPRLAQSSN